LRLFDSEPALRKRLEKRLKGPTLWEGFSSMLRRMGFAKADAADIARIYRDPKHHDLRMLCEAMIEYDELFGLWREHHVRMAERMIGGKPGTGKAAGTYALGQQGPMGTHGVAYLQSTLGKKFFPVLWDARTIL
jgi:tryptophan 2,3-dioxygenase